MLRVLSWLVPYKTLNIATTLTPAEVRSAMRETVHKHSGWFQRAAPFEGTISDPDFRFRPSITYRNSFRPVVTGTILPERFGARLHVRMRMTLPVMVFMAFWLCSVVAGLVTFGVGFRLEEATAAAAMLGLGLLITNFGFHFEARKVEALLSRALPHWDSGAITPPLG
jgi:hypothetical protein